MGNIFSELFTKKKAAAEESGKRPGSENAARQATVRPNFWFETLNVAQNCSESELKYAYRKLVSKYHPDRYPSDQKDIVDQAVRKMTLLNKAYQEGRSHLKLNKPEESHTTNKKHNPNAHTFKSKFD